MIRMAGILADNVNAFIIKSLHVIEKNVVLQFERAPIEIRNHIKIILSSLSRALIVNSLLRVAQHSSEREFFVGKSVNTPEITQSKARSIARVVLIFMIESCVYVCAVDF